MKLIPRTTLACLASGLLALASVLQPQPSLAQELPVTAPVPGLRPGIDPDPQANKLPPLGPIPMSPPPHLRPDRQADPVNQGGKVPAAATPLQPNQPSVAELACRTRLRELGTVFSITSIPAPTNGCALPFPVAVSKIGSGAEIRTEITLNCETALATANFVRDVIQPAARDIFGTGVKSIQQASGYVCRPRNGTSKLSEHAFGNAIDIAAFTLADGQIVEVRPSPPPKHAQFLKRVRDAACGPYKTVLGPGSNADHEFHFHFDLAARRNGGTYCK